jgi:hypothetical protein|tara:strand:+ start:61 stop:273 length:213 start_codon:yes stop_codon:yes gene_type:complete
MHFGDTNYIDDLAKLDVTQDMLHSSILPAPSDKKYYWIGVDLRGLYYVVNYRQEDNSFTLVNAHLILSDG